MNITESIVNAQEKQKKIHRLKMKKNDFTTTSERESAFDNLEPKSQEDIFKRASFFHFRYIEKTPNFEQQG